jgi:hypothetical protein
LIWFNKATDITSSHTRYNKATVSSQGATSWHHWHDVALCG